jgi:transposase
MSANFVSVDRNQSLLLPPDLKDWVPGDDLVHFVVAAVEGLNASAFRVNHRGTGSAQYPPAMMLALLIYCYANGIFSSRRIERATYRDIAVRYLTADTHPDHDTIAKFRRENFDAVAACFVHVLELAQAAGLLKVGTVSVDGTKLKANASIDRNVRYDRAGQLIEQLEREVHDLLEQAEETDGQDEADGQQLPEELARREGLKEKLEAARAQIEARRKAKAETEQAEYERKVKERADKGEKRGREPKAPDPEPAPRTQQNLTDPDSRLMRKNLRSGFEQAYNAQATVDADGTQLILAARVTNHSCDKNELLPDIEAIPPSLGQPTNVLADTGYLNRRQAAPLEAQGLDLYIATGKEGRRRKHDFRPEPKSAKPKPQIRSPWIRAMKDKLLTDEGRARYARRQCTVEPVFGIIKAALGFRQFHLRGKEKAQGEWTLIALAYNLKRLHTLDRGNKVRPGSPTTPQRQPDNAITVPARLAVRFMLNALTTDTTETEAWITRTPLPSPTGC